VARSLLPRSSDLSADAIGALRTSWQPLTSEMGVVITFEQRENGVRPKRQAASNAASP
jgi:hypothetical protein